MSVVARRTQPGVPQAGLRRIVGTRFEVDSQIVEYRAAGRLRSKTRAVPVPGQPGVVEAYVVLSDPPSKTVPKVLAGLAVLAVAVAVWLVVVNLAAIVAALAGLALVVAGYFIVVALFSDGCEITVIHRRR